MLSFFIVCWFVVFSLYVQEGYVLLIYLWAHWFFPWEYGVQYWSLRSIFHLSYSVYFLFPSIFICLSLMKSPICLCMLFTLSSRNLNLLITIVLNHLLNSFNILWLFYKSGFVHCFVFQCFFFLALLYAFPFLSECSTLVRTL